MTIKDPTDVGFINATVDQILEDHYRAKANHSVRKLSPDEVWMAVALDHYDDMPKAPSGELYKTDASKLLGILNQCSDDGLWQLAKFGTGAGLTMKDARDVFRRMAAILLKRRGVQGVGRILT